MTDMQDLSLLFWLTDITQHWLNQICNSYAPIMLSDVKIAIRDLLEGAFLESLSDNGNFVCPLMSVD